MSSWVDDHERYERLAREACEVARLTTKDGAIWGLVGTLLQVVSLGRFSRRRFLQQFATTFGPIQAYPAHWETLSLYLIAHEGRHSRQFLFAGWFVPVLGWLGPRWRCWAGVLPMAFVYGCFPLPFFFAWGRFRLELDADAHAWRQELASGRWTPDDVRQRAREFAGLVSSWAYLRAWPRRWTERAFAARAEQVISECR